MSGAMRFLLKTQLRSSKLVNKTSGFTLIELLVAMIIAALVITPLLGFMITILNTDRQEQAKGNSEQEIQSALDYITRDLEQAVYIYDGAGLTVIKDQLPTVDEERVPVLVFWKREQVKNAVTINNNYTASTNAEQLCSAPPNTPSKECNEAFVYSLVAYYLITEKDDTWSTAARIGRFQIKDGVKNPIVPTNLDKSPNYLTYVPSSDSRNRDQGFKIFDLNASGSTLEIKMNQWKKKSAEDYGNKIVPLIDYVDQSTLNTPPQVSCKEALSSPDDDAKLTTPHTTINTNKYTSFYACVDTKANVAQVYLRGNALARLKEDAKYSSRNSIYFPSASIKVKGRGFLLVE